MDIVKRLRYEAKTVRENHPETFCVKEDTADEAANEIERLRNFLEILSDKLYDKQDYELWAAVRNTLWQEGEKDEQA